MQLLLDLSTYSKGDFPFKFNTAENQNYVGPLPAIENYNPNMKSEKVRNDLITWHSKLTESSYIFDFQKEMYIYCAQDVTILRLCCMQFRNLFLSETGELILFVIVLSLLLWWLFIAQNIWKKRQSIEWL